MFINKLDKFRNSQSKGAASLAKDHEAIFALDQVNSMFDEEFSIRTFDTIANSYERPVRRMRVKGREIGSDVMGGSAEYFLQFC